MLRRHLWLARAQAAAGLFACLLLAGTATTRAGEPAEPLPAPNAATQTVEILQGQKEGAIQVVVRGQGADRVKFNIKNNSGKRLRVVIPPGLVAASNVAQAGGAGGGGPGFQSMGLGLPTNAPGSFGQFRNATTETEAEGFRSVPLQAGPAPDGVIVPENKDVTFIVPSVCLNFGVNTPTARNIFKLMTVESYTQDERARKALKSAAILGTSQGVAQAAMWHVFNGMSFEQIATEAAKYVNVHEVALAARFIAVLDESDSRNLVDPAYLEQGRVLVRIQGDPAFAKEVGRLHDQFETLSLLGLPVRVVDEIPTSDSAVSSLFVDIVLTGSAPKQTSGRLVVRHASPLHGWTQLGSPAFKVDGHISTLDGKALADAADRTLAAAFVNARPTRQTPGLTAFRIDNRLPFTISSLRIRTGRSEDAGTVTLDRLGLGPARSTVTSLPAAMGVVEKVVLNGL
jgi:hypothetical protein